MDTSAMGNGQEPLRESAPPITTTAGGSSGGSGHSNHMSVKNTSTATVTTSTTTTTPRPYEECQTEYAQLRATSQYPSISPPVGNGKRSWWKSSALLVEEQCQTYLSSRDVLAKRVGKLCVVTGVSSVQSPAFVVAQELALTAGMHVILVGRAHLATCQHALRKEAKARQIPVKLFATKMNLASLDSIRQAADYVTHLAHLKYDGQCHLVVNMAHVGTSEARLTTDGLEHNTGCNLVGTQYFTKLLLPLLSQAAPHGRVIHASSMGHCLGTNFNPQRFIDHPAEGGAPVGFLQQATRQHDVATSLLASDEVLQLNQVEASYSAEQHRQAVQKQGTQVGRSKMALMASTQYMSRLNPDIGFFTFHLIPSPPRSSWFPRRNGSNNEHVAALPALRAALDDELCPNLYNPPLCYYLHGDGNPWNPMPPAQDDAFAKACYEACEQVIHNLVKNKRGGTAPGDASPYRPPQLKSAK